MTRKKHELKTVRGFDEFDFAACYEAVLLADRWMRRLAAVFSEGGKDDKKAT